MKLKQLHRKKLVLGGLLVILVFSSFLYLPVQADDSDDDGMPDGWEDTYNLNPLVDDASGDSDSDGLSNLGEYQAGTA